MSASSFTCSSCKNLFYVFSLEETPKCPNCGLVCDENSSTDNLNFDKYVEELKNRGGGCGPNSGCCG